MKQYNIKKYILIKISLDYSGNQVFVDFINNNIGKLSQQFIVNGNRVGEDEDVCFLEIIYKNIPQNIKAYFNGNNNMLRITTKHLVEHSDNIDDLKAILTAKKFNI